MKQLIKVYPNDEISHLEITAALDNAGVPFFARLISDTSFPSLNVLNRHSELHIDYAFHDQVQEVLKKAKKTDSFSIEIEEG